MKTIKPNNLDQAIKEIEAIDKELVGKVKEEIKHSDRRHNHVIAIKVLDRPGEVKNKVVVSTLILNDDKLEKIRKSFKFLGYSRLIVLHDAKLVKEDVAPTLHVQESESIALKVKRELEAKHQAEIDELRKKYESEAIEDKTQKKESKEPTELDIDYQEAMSGNKDELVSFMEKYDIDQTDITNNEGRKDAIKAFYESVQNVTKYDV